MLKLIAIKFFIFIYIKSIFFWWKKHNCFLIELLLWCYWLFLRIEILKIRLKMKKKFYEIFFSIIKYVLIIWLIVWIIIVVLIILKFFEIIIIFSIFFVVIIWSSVSDLRLIFSWRSVFFSDYVSLDVFACVKFLKKIFNCDNVDKFMKIPSQFDLNVIIYDVQLIENWFHFNWLDSSNDFLCIFSKFSAFSNIFHDVCFLKKLNCDRCCLKFESNY